MAKIQNDRELKNTKKLISQCESHLKQLELELEAAGITDKSSLDAQRTFKAQLEYQVLMYENTDPIVEIDDMISNYDDLRDFCTRSNLPHDASLYLEFAEELKALKEKMIKAKK